MCVIIYKPKNETITKDEVTAAWRTNPDGAGYAYTTRGHVVFQRGFMNLEEYWEKINQLQNKNLLLHLRISTGGGINARNTHPYKAGNIAKQSGRTRRPVICMNGVIRGQTLKTGWNDTASYIAEHRQTFKHITQDILNIIGEATGAAWAAATPQGIMITPDFIEYSGIYYSNLNHHYQYTAAGSTNRIKLKQLIKNKKLYKQVKKDKNLYYELEDYVYFNCDNFRCWDCPECITGANTINDLKRITRTYPLDYY